MARYRSDLAEATVIPTGHRFRTAAVPAVMTLVLALAPWSPARAAAAPPAGTVQSATDLGPITWDSRVMGRDGGFSVKWGNASIWMFGDTLLTVPGSDGDRWADNTAAVTADLNGADGVSLVSPNGWEHADAAGLPTEYLPFSAWENWFNHHNDPVRCGQSGVGDCGKQYFLWPGQPIADPARDRVLYFYVSGIRGGSVTDTFGQYWGSGIAVWDATANTVTRPETGPPPGGPSWDKWNLFHAGERGHGGLMTVGDTLYSTGCVRDYVIFHCELARVPLADALDRSAWRFYAGGGQWSADIGAAVPVFDGSSSNSMYYNTHLGKYVVVYGLNTVYYRTASQPWGPWSDEAELFDTLPPAHGYNYFGLAHPEYGSGKTLYVTNYRNSGTNTGEVRLTKVVFD